MSERDKLAQIKKAQKEVILATGYNAKPKTVAAVHDRALGACPKTMRLARAL